MRPVTLGWAILLGGFLLACWTLSLTYYVGNRNGMSVAREALAFKDSLIHGKARPVFLPDGRLAYLAPRVDSSRAHDTVAARRR